MKGRVPNFDWSILATLFDATSSLIPGDIEFKVVDQQDQVVDTLAAHKVILAVHSNYFRTAFFGTGTSFKDQKDGIVLIKETTKEAFRDLLGFMYEKEINFEEKTLTELFEILNLAQRYQVDMLKDVVSDFITDFPLSLDNVVMVAATSEEMSHFEEVSTDLGKACVDLLATQLVNVRSVLNFISNNEDGATVVKLLKDLDIKNERMQDCDNCGKNPCLNKSSIIFNDLASGQVIQTTNSTSWQSTYRLQVCRVASVSVSGATVAWVNPPNSAKQNTYPKYNMERFTYMCHK